MTVRVTGWAELRSAFNTLAEPDRVETAIVTALNPFATKLRGLAATHSRNLASQSESRSKGRIDAGLRVFKTKRKIGVRSSAPGAGAQEFGRHYSRRSKAGGEHEVTMHSPPARILFKAAAELQAEEGPAVEKAMDDIWRSLGFEVR